MRTLQPGFDPFQRNGWLPFETGGLEAVREKEAPLLMYAFDTTNPDLANVLADQYEKDGLRPTDLRFGVWADARPQPRREEGEAPGVHLNVFGARQIKYEEATPPERAALNALTTLTVKHLRAVLSPAHGVTVQVFNEQVPTMHTHIIARERPDDGLDWVRERPLVGLDHRRAVAARASFELVLGRQDAVTNYLANMIADTLDHPSPTRDPF